MFVPVSDSGEVLEEPQPGLINDWYFDSALDEYRKAKEKCLFEGFEIDENYLFHKSIGHDIFFKYPYGWRLDNVSFEFVEDLIRLNLPLTAQSIKMILG